MSLNKNQILRVFYIMELLKSANKPLPRQRLINEIEMFLKKEGEKETISDRTFYRDLTLLKKAPFSLKIIIKNKSGYVLEKSSPDYYDIRPLLEPLHLLDLLSIERGLNNVLIGQTYQEKGIRWLRTLVNAIHENKKIVIYYSKYNEDDFIKRNLEPYYLKEFNGRWYLIAYDIEVEGFRTFGLDRIEDLEKTKFSFKKNEEYDIRKQFQDSYGIYSDPSYPVEDIIFKVDKIDTAYLQSNPLHDSQELISEEDGYSTFKIHVRYTKDLLMALLSRSWSMEIISPAYIRSEYADILKQAFERNK